MMPDDEGSEKGRVRASARAGWAALALLALLGGCAPVDRVREETRAHWGPTYTLQELVSRVNQRNAALPTLYARHYIEASIYNPDRDRFSFLNAEGDVFVLQPRDLLLRGRKDVFGEVFQIGSTRERYWMSVFEGDDTMWWGWYRNIGRPCAGAMPIRPDAMGEVLGVGQIQTDLKVDPIPTMRFNNDLAMYMVTWAAEAPTHWYTEKEIWYAHETLLPVKVLLFDRNGRIVLRADLSQHQPVDVAGTDADQRPMVATYYDLFFPETRSTMQMRLSDLALQTRTGQPKPGMIQFPAEPGVSKVIQIDADCD
jgi:hypothetical protein